MPPADSRCHAAWRPAWYAPDARVRSKSAVSHRRMKRPGIAMERTMRQYNADDEGPWGPILDILVDDDDDGSD